LDPKGGIEKEYLVRVDRELWTKEGEISRKVEGILRTLRRGVTVDDIRYNAKEVDVINANQLRFILTEGKNRHIRKMCEKVDLKVLALKRVRIGGIKLGALPVGEWRYLQLNDKLL
jgi:23S rRNA pseudouridine2604 synthase